MEHLVLAAVREQLQHTCQCYSAVMREQPLDVLDHQNLRFALVHEPIELDNELPPWILEATTFPCLGIGLTGDAAG